MKRVFDLTVATISCILLSPLLLIISIIIKLDSNGPVIFKQIRVGLKGQEFAIWKFRTMVTNAEIIGPQITIGQDPRITKFGKLLRKSKLDELPQLFNVLWGEMSLVGPRPEVARYVKLYDATIRQEVLSVKPGITDYASLYMIDENEILARSDNPEDAYINEIMPHKLNLALKYVRKHNLLVDIVIIMKTVGKIIFR